MASLSPETISLTSKSILISYYINAASTPNVTTAIASAIHARSPATITCTVTFSSTIMNDATVVISWSKDGQQLHNTSKVVITSTNITAVSFQSNLTIHVLEISDSGLYSCSVVLLSLSTQNPILSPTVSTLHFEVEGIEYLVRD